MDGLVSSLNFVPRSWMVGVPRRGIYDNMKTAVDKVNKGKGAKPVEHCCSICCQSYTSTPA
ncbi:MAG: hypothetical protein ACXWU9_18810, partial [Telluria sp.]